MIGEILKGILMVPSFASVTLDENIAKGYTATTEYSLPDFNKKITKPTAVSGDTEARGDLVYGWANRVISTIVDIRVLIITIAVLALVVDLLGYYLSPEESREKFKRALPVVIAGVIVVSLSVSIASVLVRNVGSSMGNWE